MEPGPSPPARAISSLYFLKGSIRKHLNGGGADRLKTLIETPFPQCLPHKAAEFKDFNNL